MLNGGADTKRRIALLVEYDGTDFCGWQWQTEERTVQNTLEKAVSGLFQQPVRVIGCSRTDAGVHAAGHVSHFTASGTIPTDRIHLALNAALPDDVGVRQAFDVSEDFHAQFDARAKTYTYQVWNDRIRPVLARLTTSHEPRPLDYEAMVEAARHLIGTHDFSSFMAAGGTVKTTVRTLMDVRVEKDAHRPVYTFSFSGNGFLYNMVRILSGTLLYVGLGKIRADAMPGIIGACDRDRAGKTLPASGLTLDSVYYRQDGKLKTFSGEEVGWDVTRHT